MGFISFAIRNWKLIVGAGIVLAFLLGAWYIDHRAYNRGYDERAAEYEQALKEAQDKAQSNTVKTGKHYDLITEKIRAIPDKGCVGDAVRNAIERLQ